MEAITVIVCDLCAGSRFDIRLRKVRKTQASRLSFHKVLVFLKFYPPVVVLGISNASPNNVALPPIFARHMTPQG